MSSSQQFFGNKKPSKALERTNFAHTCNLLSQYVKEKGGLKELNLEGLGGKLEAPAKSNVTTINLLDKDETLGRSSAQQAKPVTPFPRFATGDSSRNSEEPKKSSSRVQAAAVEPKRAQMTIFYAGKVLVFDDFPAEKAREVMLLASNEGSGGDLAVSKGENFCPADAVPSTSMAQPNTLSTPIQERPNPQPEANASGSDLPIARRSSLHRFLGKRKDRNVARGPYHHAQNASASSSKNDEQLELKL